MRRTLPAFCISVLALCCICASVIAAVKFEGALKPFLGEPEFEIQQVFKGGRFPNLAVATDGTVLAVFAKDGVSLKRSEDGGKTWGEAIVIANPGFMGGGVTVDEGTGDILAFIEQHHPPATLTVYRSKDHGKTWAAQKRLANPGSSAYSSMNVGRPGTPSEGWIYFMPEAGGAKVARFNLSWIVRGGEATGDGNVPGWAK